MMEVQQFPNQHHPTNPTAFAQEDSRPAAHRGVFKNKAAAVRTLPQPANVDAGRPNRGWSIIANRSLEASAPT